MDGRLGAGSGYSPPGQCSGPVNVREFQLGLDSGVLEDLDSDGDIFLGVIGHYLHSDTCRALRDSPEFNQIGYQSSSGKCLLTNRARPSVPILTQTIADGSPQ